MSQLSASTRRSVLLLSCATYSSMAVQRLCDAMLPELSREFNVGLAEAARTISFFAVVYGLCQLFYGPLGDRLGKFRVVTWATLGCSVGCVLAVFALGLDMLVVARMLTALGAAAIIPLSMAWIGDNVPYAQRQETLAKLALGTTLGLTSGQVFGGLFTDTLGWRWAFVLMTLLFGAAGVLLWREGRRMARQHAGAVHTDQAETPRLGFVRQAWAIVTGRWSRVVLIVALIEGATGFGALAIWATHLHAELGLSLSAAGVVVALFGAGGVVYMVTARWLIPRLGEAGLVRSGVSLLGAGAVVVAYSPLAWPAAPACLVAGFGFFMLHNTMQTNATQMAPAARGTAVSLFAAFLFIGQSIGVLLAAALAARLGSAPTIAGAGLILCALGWGFAALLRRRHLPTEPVEPF
ncbi:transporter [Hylemonella gracilis str. Niagara R]|uniref:Transporter n=1 Tax=Hylemonella gracilis str. Niagara R TaxID=1458275 RepID=A0A016XF05_9BURK|nr:MFS transporter [Hylemonella gracilis]EYC49808.1 transporter [Hylemonella gracilis str. Niagara R]